MNDSLPPFHLAIPVHDIEAARRFYGEVLGFDQGRSDTRWTDWNFAGHQVVTHQVGDTAAADPSGNAMEFKAFADPGALFAT